MEALNLSPPKIGTVEEFQGQERLVIIVSVVRSSLLHTPNNIAKSLGFTACPRRINVALTRARAVLVILGNPISLSKYPYWRSVVKYCGKNNCITGCNIRLFYKNDELEENEKEGKTVKEEEEGINEVS